MVYVAGRKERLLEGRKGDWRAEERLVVSEVISRRKDWVGDAGWEKSIGE